jgi:glycosyltransferase involved in cell wall biosynthesis
MKQRGFGSIRVLFFISEYHRFHGAQRSLLQLVRNLPSAGVEPVVVFPSEGRCTTAYREAGVNVDILPGPPLLTKFGKNLLDISLPRKLATFSGQIVPYSFKIAAYMKQQQAVLLHCIGPRSLLLAGYVPALRGIPIVSHIRGFLTSYNRWQRFLLGALPSRIVFVSDSVRSELSRRFWGKSVTIYNGIDQQAIQSADDSEGHLLFSKQEGTAVIVIIGAVVPEKGHHHLVRAACLVNQCLQGPRPRFIALGECMDERYRRHLDRLIAQYRLDNFQFLGWRDNPFPYYRMSDIVVLPSIIRERILTEEGPLEAQSGEGLPRTVLEAMYLGKPVVASEIAGVPEMVVNGETGYVVPPADPEKLAEAICHLLESPDKRRVMGEAGATRVRSLFTTEVMVQKTVALYRELVEKR